jgi:ribosomal protein S18 acetylase RimI-like enzyme
MDRHDFDAILALWQRSWQAAFPQLHHPQSSDGWRVRLRDEVMERNSVWVAELDATIVGFMAMDVASGYIDQLFVDVTAQRQGIGSALIHLAMERSPTGLRLHTLIENAPARVFYEKHGFRAGALETNAFNGLPNVEYVWRPGQ